MIAYKTLRGKPNKKILKGFINFGYLENSGAAKGRLAGRYWLLVISTLIYLVLIYFCFYYFDLKNYLVYSLGLCLFLSGCLGNFIDRVLRGYVIDFIYFKPRKPYTLVYNI